jgi:Protein of unknown function (DUF3072)
MFLAHRGAPRPGTNHDRARCPPTTQHIRNLSDTTPPSNTQKDPGEWTTGDETMTGAQASYLKSGHGRYDVRMDSGLDECADLR